MANQAYLPINQPEHEIRILYLGASQHEPLSCRLENISLDTSPQQAYLALSWCWGDQSRQKKIIVNNVEVDIPENAYEIIRWLGKSAYAGPFWLDAICINQSDIRERGQQVALMRRIYSDARKVLVCLDLNGKDEVGEAVSASLAAIVTQCKDATNDLNDLRGQIVLQEGAVKRILYSDESLPTLCDWDSLLKFFACPWFTRLWVVQEVVLAHDVDCIFGSWCIKWKDVAVAAVWMNHRKYWRGPLLRGPLVRGPGTIGIDNSAMFWHRSDAADGFYPSLIMGTGFKCSDPRDKVYGVLGLGTAETSTQIVPDYTKPVSKVYIEATRVSIAEKKHLHILAYANAMDAATKSTSLMVDLPSWVPRFDLSFVRAGNSYHIALMEFGRGANNDIPPRLHDDSAKPEILTVQGSVVDVVSYVSNQLTEILLRRNIDLLLDDLHSFWYLASQSMNTIYSQNADFGSIMFRTCITGALHEANTSNDDQVLREQFDAFVLLCGLDRYSPAYKVPGVRSSREDIGYDATVTATRAYLDAIWLHSINRRFLITKRGYIGIGPRDVQIGDEVCILFGSRIPFILRAADDEHHYIFVGDTYIDGIMQGEYIQNLQDTNTLESAVRIFKLR